MHTFTDCPVVPGAGADEASKPLVGNGVACDRDAAVQVVAAGRVLVHQEAHLQGRKRTRTRECEKCRLQAGQQAILTS